MQAPANRFRPRFVRRGLALVVAVAALGLAACSRITAENYAKVKVGMPREQVYGILGKPDEISGGALGPFNFSAESWKGREQSIHVTFGADKVAMKTIGRNPLE